MACHRKHSHSHIDLFSPGHKFPYLFYQNLNCNLPLLMIMTPCRTSHNEGLQYLSNWKKWCQHCQRTPLGILHLRYWVVLTKWYDIKLCFRFGDALHRRHHIHTAEGHGKQCINLLIWLPPMRVDGRLMTHLVYKCAFVTDWFSSLLPWCCVSISI